MCGVLYVMTTGQLLMPMWLADNWVTLEQVRNYSHIAVISVGQSKHYLFDFQLVNFLHYYN